MTIDSPYWKKTRRVTVQLLVVWAIVTFGFNFFAAELNQFSLFGFPLGFYMAAQGEMLIYLGIIWIYNRRMDRLDSEFSVKDD